MSPCSLNLFLLLYVIRPPTATSCCFSSAIYGSDVCFFLLYYCCRCVVLLFLSLCLFVSTAHAFSLVLSQSHPLAVFVAQRQVVISACDVSFRYLSFFSFFFLLRHLSPLLTAAFFVFLFSLLLLLHHRHHLSFSFTFSLFSLAILPPPSLCPPTYTPSLAHDLLPPPSTPPLAPIPASLSGPRMSDAAQSAPR